MTSLTTLDGKQIVIQPHDERTRFYNINMIRTIHKICHLPYKYVFLEARFSTAYESYICNVVIAVYLKP